MRGSRGISFWETKIDKINEIANSGFFLHLFQIKICAASFKTSGNYTYNTYINRTYSREYGRGCKLSENGKNIWKFEQKCTKYENILEKSRWLHAIIAQKL